MKQNFKKTLVNICMALAITSVVTPAYAQLSDKVLVIVNDDVITQSEFDFRLASVVSDAIQSGQELPDDTNKQLLDSMISDRLQIQEAELRELVVSDQDVDEAIARFATQQGQTVAELESSLGNIGQAILRFRETVRDSLTISLLTEYYANNRVFVPDYEVDGAISQNKLGEAAVEYQIAHLFIAEPEVNRTKAQEIHDEIVKGLDFSAAVAQYSQGAGAANGGLIGWRKVDSLPEIFANAVTDIEVGSISAVLESENGLHILKLVDRKGERIEILQSNVRHILIEAESDIAMRQAEKKLNEIRARVLAGEDFGQLARIYSDDSVSAANGGDLEWVNPGQMVKPFEESFQKLSMNEVSEPVITEYGAHIIQVMDRRQENVTEIVTRNRVRGVLRRQRAGREFSQWVRQLKEKAYISHVSEPAS